MFITEDGQIQSEAPQTYQIKGKNNKHRKNRKYKRHSKLRKVIKAFFITLLIVFLLLVIAGGYVAYELYNIVKDAKLSENDLVIKYENSVIKDMQGNTLGVLNGDENRESIPLSEMPEYLPKAFISIEDERFYEHKGVDIKRTAKATYTYITNEGNSPFGGSTITQQLVKNLTQEKDVYIYDTESVSEDYEIKAYFLEIIDVYTPESMLPSDFPEENLKMLEEILVPNIIKTLLK